MKRLTVALACLVAASISPLAAKAPATIPASENGSSGIVGEVPGAPPQDTVESNWEDKFIKLQPGQDAPRFTLRASDGKQLSLTDIKDKIIILDFWGSWCGWCIHGFPKMKEYYGKYRDRIEIIGMAYGDTDESWAAALEKHQLPWKNVIDPTDSMIPKYGVHSMPTKVVIGPDYKIVNVFVGETEDFYTQLDEMLK